MSVAVPTAICVIHFAFCLKLNCLILVVGALCRHSLGRVLAHGCIRRSPASQRSRYSEAVDVFVILYRVTVHSIYSFHAEHVSVVVPF